MSYFSGVNGRMEIDGQKAAGIRSWQISSSLGVLDATTLGDTDKVGVPGLRTTTGSCTLLYYQETPGQSAGNSCSELIRVLMKGRTRGDKPGQAAESQKVTFRLRIEDGTVAGKYVAVDAYLTSAQMQMAVSEVLQAQVSFEVIGAPLEVSI
jgi:hypothetical protein